MRNRGRRRNAGRRLGAVGAGVLDPKFVILTITDSPTSPGTALVTTAAAHGLDGTAGNIVVSGNTVSEYNTTIPFSSASAGQEIHTDHPYSSDGAGGTWRLA